MERSIERRYKRKDFVGRMLGTGQGRGKCYGKAKGEVDPSTLGKITLLKNYYCYCYSIMEEGKDMLCSRDKIEGRR